MNTKNQTAPPELALRLFRWYCRHERLEELEGDLCEMHEYRLRKGGYSPVRLRFLFWLDVFRCFRSYSVKSTQNKMNTALYTSYIKLGYRNAWKNKGPVLVNVLGLGLSVGFCMTVYMILAYNLEFDTFYKNTSDLYRVHSLRTDNNQTYRYELAPLAMVNYLESSVAGVDKVFQFHMEETVVEHRQEFYKENTAFVSTNFLDVMELPLKYGSKQALKEANTIFLTEALADKYFPDQVPVGEHLTVYLRGNKQVQLIVGGVFHRIPLNTSFFFSALVSHPTLEAAADLAMNDWSTMERVGIYFSSKAPESVGQQLGTLIPLQNEKNKKWQIKSLEVVPFIDEKVADHIINYSPTNMRIRPEVLIIFGVMALLILLVATFNITNTSIALISKRLKEVGIRKTLGTHSQQIFIQFLFEMLVITTGGLAIALMLCNVFANEFFGQFGFSFLLDEVNMFRLIPFVLAFLTFITLLAGGVPALYAKKFETIAILNKRYKLRGVGWANQLLTMGQYAFSIAVLITGISFARNTTFMENFDFGFNADNLMVFTLEDSRDLDKLEGELLKLSEVVGVSRTKHHHDMAASNSLLKNDTAEVEVKSFVVGADYHQLMEIGLQSGRYFNGKSSADQATALIVNKEFARRYLVPGSELNSIVQLDGVRRTVVGIAEQVSSDVYADAVARPEVYLLGKTEDFTRLLVRTGLNHSQTDIEAQFKAVWIDLFDMPFGGNWQHSVTGFYAVRDSRNLKNIFLSLAGLGCFLSLMGIFSLASINVVKKTKEISIRKILGAGFMEINLSINRNFSLILLASLFAGIGLGYVISESIFQSIYMHYQGISLFTSSLVGLFIVGSALVFVLVATFRPMLANPSDGLRTE